MNSRWEIMSSKSFVKSELFDCTASIEQFVCPQCPSFKTNCLTTLRHHVEGGHAQQSVTEVVYRCLKCPFVTHSKYFSIKHHKFDVCVSRDHQKFGKNEQRKQLSCKVVEVAKQAPKDAGRYESFLNEILTNQFSKDTIKYDRNSSYSKPSPKADLGVEEYVLVTYKDKNKDKLFKCEQCFYRTSKKTHLKSHKLRKHTPEDQLQWLQCEYCPYICTMKTNLRRHLLTKHTSDVRVQWLRCELCDYKTVEEAAFKKHITNKHSQKNQAGVIRCAYCDYQTSAKRNLNAHMMVKHTPGDQVRWLYCEHCEYKTTQKCHLQAHVLGKHLPHLRTPRFSCDHCHYKTEEKNKLKRHLNAKHAHLLRCGFCNYLSADEFLLNLHVALRHRPEEQT